MIPLIVALPLVFAFIGAVLSVYRSFRKYMRAAFLAGVLSPWPVFIMDLGDHPVETVVGGWTRVSGIEIGMNGLNFHLILAALIVFSLSGVYSVFYFDRDQRDKGAISGRSILPLILLLYSGILGCFLTRDLFNFFVYMEIASISSIIMVACSKGKGSKRASFRYLVLFFISSFFFLFAIGIIYVNTGTLNFNLIEENLVMDTEIKVAITIAFVSFITKAGIFPLYFWLPEAHSKADTPVSALLSGLTVKVPVFGMILFLVYTDIGFLKTPLMIVAFSSILFGIVMAILQKNVKRMLAYSTVSQMGFILLAIATLNASAAVNYAFAHALFKSGLFLGVGVLINRHGTKNIDELSCKDDNLLVLSMIILTLAIGGVSPLIGAFGKHEILSGLSGLGVYLFYIGSIGTLTYFINLNYSLFNLESLGKKYHSVEGFITFMMAVLTVAFGIYYYPRLKLTDLLLIGVAFLMFAVLKYAGIFEKRVPRYFSRDIKGLGGEINLYTSVYVSVMISLLIYVLH